MLRRTDLTKTMDARIRPLYCCCSSMRSMYLMQVHAARSEHHMQVHSYGSVMGPVNLCFGHAHIFGVCFGSCESTTTPPCTRTFAAPEGCCYVRTLQVAGRLCLPTPTHASCLFSASLSAFVSCPGASVAHIRSNISNEISDCTPPSLPRPARTTPRSPDPFIPPAVRVWAHQDKERGRQRTER